MRRVLALLLGLLLAPATRAEDEAPPATIDLTGATVLASPGAPEGLFPFLPGGKAPAALTWPLPDGPVLALGLPRTDPAAADLAFFYDLLGPTEDLGGGYLVAAWHDGTRPIGVILADDAAALYAARFELESVPRRQGMESLDFTKPPAEAGIRLRKGRHVVRPRFRIRAYWPKATTRESVLTAIAGRANRYWFPGRAEQDMARALPRLLRHGVHPCYVLEVRADEAAAEVVRRAGPWVRRGVRHLVVCPTPFEVPEGHVRRIVGALRAAYDPAEITLDERRLRVPGTIATLYPTRWGAEHTLPEIQAAAATGPLLLVDLWAFASRTPVPSRPRRAPSGVDRLVDGVLVIGGPGAREVLEDAWASGPEGPEEWESVLLPLLPRTPLAPRVFLEETIARIETLDPPTRRTVDWLDPLVEVIRSNLDELSERAVLVPRVPVRVTPDGRLDEPAWAHAARIDLTLPGQPPGRVVTFLAVTNGHALHVALRAPEHHGSPPLALSPRARNESWIGGEGIPITRVATSRHFVGRRTWEGTLGYWELCGDAHPTRVFHLWHLPEGGAPKRLASLVLGP